MMIKTYIEQSYSIASSSQELKLVSLFFPEKKRLSPPRRIIQNFCVKRV